MNLRLTLKIEDMDTNETVSDTHFFHFFNDQAVRESGSLAGGEREMVIDEALRSGMMHAVRVHSGDIVQKVVEYIEKHE